MFGYYYFDTGNVQAAHGRAPAVATGIKRSHPGSIVISYQGDGDLAAIGTAEIIHAANRGENITVFFVNNSIYGMTGGQMAPTTLVGQTSTTTPWGRRPNNDGFPIKMAELIATLEAPVYVERVACRDNKHIIQARSAVKKALELQKQGAGFTMVEILSPCPTILKMEPMVARHWVGETLAKQFPLGVFRDRKPEMVSGGACRRKAWRSCWASPAEPADGSRAPRAAAAYPREDDQGCRLWRTGRAAAGTIARRDGHARAHGSELAAQLRAGNALGQRHCHVTLSHQRIGSPVITHPEVLVAMNEPSLRKFGPQVKTGGVILYNGHRLPEDLQFEGVTVDCVPA